MNDIRNNDILVSIIMPAYNAGAYLRQSVGDLLAQTFSAWELFCVNDGSTDGSEEIMADLASQDARIHILTQENRGGGGARNAGFAKAQGKYVIFLDADDRFEAELLERAVEKAETEQSDIVVFDGDKFDYYTGKVSSAPWLLFGRKADACQNPFAITGTTVWNKLFRRSFLVENRIYHQEERVTAFSLYFTAVALLYAVQVSRVDRVLVHYRSDNPSSSLPKHDRQPLDTLEILAAVKDKLAEDGRYEAQKSLFLNFALKEIMNRLGLFQSYDGYKALYDALREWGYHKLDLIDHDDLLDDAYLREQKNQMLQMPLEEYLFHREKRCQEHGFLQRTNYLLPEGFERIVDNQLTQKRKQCSVRIGGKQTEEKCRIFLYGAGMVGKCYFSQLMSRRDILLVGWVDREYETHGFPVQSPDIVPGTEFDLLLIGVEQEAVAEKIRADMMARGILASKMFWAVPERMV